MSNKIDEKFNNEYILLTGGAGYIGTHTDKLLNDEGLSTIVFDNLSEGNETLIQSDIFIKGDLNDKKLLSSVFKQYNIVSVIHLAGSCYVGESVTNPSFYYNNNIVNTINLLDIMIEHDVKNIIFSSSCASYGTPQYHPITEVHSQIPVSPYGKTKLMIENILEDYDNAYGLKYVNLRYFNVAGADQSGLLGENHDPETHIIPLILQTLLGERESFTVFDNDYETTDGYCIRDYVHVNDIALGNYMSLLWLRNNQTSNSFNLANSYGVSIMEIINHCEEITNSKLNYSIAERRKGDPAILIGDAAKANKILGWHPKHSDIKSIINTSLIWHSKNTK